MKRVADIPNSELSHCIDEYIHSERDRRILKDRLIDGKHLNQLTEDYELSIRCIQYIISNGIDIITKHI